MGIDPGKSIALSRRSSNRAPSKESEQATLPLDDKSGDEEAIQTSDGPSVPYASKARLIALVLTLTGAAFLNILSVQAVVIVLPTIGESLRIPFNRQQWIVSAYSLTFGCFLLLWGRLADVYGKRRIFIFGSAWLTSVTIAIPFSPNEIVFDVLRGLQGLGAAANVPTAIGILGITFPPGKAKNYAFTCYSAGTSLGSVTGNVLAGLIGEYLTWKWIFWILAIFAALVTVAGILLIPIPQITGNVTESKASVDWLGGALITSGLMALMFALTEGNVVGWSTPWIPVLIVTSVLLVAGFVLWQWYLERKTSRSPLMKVSIFKNIRFVAALIIVALSLASFSNYLVFATFFYQDYLGLSIIQTTLRFIPTGVTGLIVSIVTAVILSWIRADHILIFSTACLTIASVLVAVPIPPSTTYWAYGFPAMCLSIFGVDALYPTLTLFVAQSLPQTDQALGGGLINSVLQIGRAMGVAIATAVQMAVEAKYADGGVNDAVSNEKAPGDPILLKGLRAANWFDVGLGVAAFVVVMVAFRGVGKVGVVKK